MPAVRLAGAATALSERYSMPLIPLLEAVMLEGLAVARQELDEEAYAAAWRRAGAMAPEAYIAEALAVEVGQRRLLLGCESRRCRRVD